jgi:hypothetical protein
VRALLLGAVALSLLAGQAMAAPKKNAPGEDAGGYREQQRDRGLRALTAPYPHLKRGQELCMASIAPGDPFYTTCRRCEKNVKYCTGDLRDRIRRSPYDAAATKCRGVYHNCKE